MFGLQDPTGTALFAPILLIAAAIGAIFNNVGAVTNATMMGNRFLNHDIHFTHHLLFDNYLLLFI